MNASPEKQDITQNIVGTMQSKALPEGLELSMPDPEKILSALKKRAETAVTKEEQDKALELASKLSRSLASKTEQAVDGTKDALIQFRTGLTPDQKRMLEDAERGIDGGVQAIKTQTKEVLASGEKALDAIKAGDMTELKKQAEGIKETVNASGQKVMEFSGMKALEKILEPIKTDGITGIFAVLANFWKFLTGGLKWTELIGNAKVDDAKRKVDEAWTTVEAIQGDVSQVITNAKSAFTELANISEKWNSVKYNEALIKCRESLKALARIREKLTPEQKEWLDQLEKKLPWNPEILMNKEKRDAWIETQVGPVSQKIADEFYAGGSLSNDQIEMVRKGLRDMHFGQDTVEMLRKRMDNPNDPTAASMSDASSFLMEMLLGNAEMLGIMFRIVPLHRFAWTVAKKTVSEWMDVYEYNLNLVFNKIKGVNPPPMTFTSDSLVSKISKMKDDQVAQDMLLMQMYRVNGLFASIAGAAVGGGISALYMAVDNSHGADGLKDFKNVISKQYGSLASEMGRIEWAFAGNSKFKPELSQMIRNELEIMKKNWLLLSLVQEGKDDATKIVSLLKNPAYQSLGILESDIMKNSQNIRGFLASKMSVEGANASSLARLPGRAFGTAAGAGGDFIDHIQDAKRFQASLMKADVMSKFQELGGSLKILTLARHADKTLLYFKDIDSATNTLRQLGAHAGPFASELLRSLPSVSLVIGGVDLATQDSRTLSESEKWKNFATIATTVLIPIVGPVMILTDKETAPKVNKDGQIENIGTGIAGLGMLGVDGFLLMNAIRANKLGGFFLERPRDVLRTVRGLIRTPTVIAHATARLVNPEWLLKTEKVLVKWGKIGKLLAATVALGAVGYAYAKDPEDHMKTLVQQGFLDGDGDITEKTKEAFIKMDLKEKKRFADTLSHAVFDRDASLPSAKSHLSEDGIYTLVVETPEGAKHWGTALNQQYTFFTEELAKLGMSVDIMDGVGYDKKQEVAKAWEKKPA